ncbi:hypothetical protein [Alienimonas chondri]|uniref:Uncharacterized protein n=1 Tax=Alienimonas chondri TaxID=2681879 RepID=A0ABX1VLL5_9PLAN|nr:hypothetical protein [Alienimonas chondri]NNJ27953.1 hypothetical protein [Alienimonas chondri]
MTDDDLDRLVQRCADGELTAPDRAALLARLNANPAAYRPLALALLERRLLDDALRETVRLESPTAPTPVPSGRDRSRPTAPWRTAAGWAASAAAGLLLGLFFNADWSPVSPSTSSSPSRPLIAAGSPGSVESMPTKPAPIDEPPIEPASRSETNGFSSPPLSEAPRPTPLAQVAWRTANGTSLSLPVYDERDVTAAMAARAADPLPAHVRAELVRSGRFAGELRQEYTVPLADGRLLTVPVHAVSVRQPEVF